jgi:hypothetical protein
LPFLLQNKLGKIRSDVISSMRRSLRLVYCYHTGVHRAFINPVATGAPSSVACASAEQRFAITRMALQFWQVLESRGIGERMNRKGLGALTSGSTRRVCCRPDAAAARSRDVGLAHRGEADMQCFRFGHGQV